MSCTNEFVSVVISPTCWASHGFLFSKWPPNDTWEQEIWLSSFSTDIGYFYLSCSIGYSIFKYESIPGLKVWWRMYPWYRLYQVSLIHFNITGSCPEVTTFFIYNGNTTRHLGNAFEPNFYPLNSSPWYFNWSTFITCVCKKPWINLRIIILYSPFKTLASTSLRMTVHQKK